MLWKGVFMTKDREIYFQELLNCVKILEKNIINLPPVGSQRKYKIQKYDDKLEKFVLVANRKGHLNLKNLTYMMISHSLGALLRLDCNGAPHDEVPTPHLHIFDKEHDNGRLAIGLSDLGLDLSQDLIASLIWFLDENKVEHGDVLIEESLV